LEDLKTEDGQTKAPGRFPKTLKKKEMGKNRRQGRGKVPLPKRKKGDPTGTLDPDTSSQVLMVFKE